MIYGRVAHCHKFKLIPMKNYTHFFVALAMKVQVLVRRYAWCFVRCSEINNKKAYLPYNMFVYYRGTRMCQPNISQHFSTIKQFLTTLTKAIVLHFIYLSKIVFYFFLLIFTFLVITSIKIILEPSLYCISI